ncbi:uncharacterized protein LOC107431391 [Ziziphus jujuba]|uniref:Uncharacterized protein LOC107431391 n=1 Tax=Ziziphus jujuba TaxID=326968 RepID=A0A6P4AJB6_ZIZJJ|nr:uncharacterized protein LOC107431391 [Ziziphus jujuba]
MGSGGCTDQLSSCQNMPPSSFEKVDDLSVVETRKGVDDEAPDVLEADESNSLGPITPDSDRENGDFPIDYKSPPTTVKKLPNVDHFDVATNRNEDNPYGCVDDGSPHTPKDGVFDPFAPGPDDLALAPQCRKYLKESRNVVVRRLNFDSYSPVDVVEEKASGIDASAAGISDREIFEAVYENLLDIVLKKTEAVLAEISDLDCESDDCKTPPLASRLDGVAETCPGAPIRPTGKSRNIDLALCRKLQFSP